MRLAILLFDFAASRHVRLANQQKEMKVLLGRQSRFVRLGRDAAAQKNQ
jgi:hypothetical protein